MAPEQVHRWRKSSYSGGNGGDCVEVEMATRSLVRDSKNPGVALALDVSALVSAVKNDQIG
jgi:hypothetical protein